MEGKVSELVDKLKAVVAKGDTKSVYELIPSLKLAISELQALFPVPDIANPSKLLLHRKAYEAIAEAAVSLRDAQGFSAAMKVLKVFYYDLGSLPESPLKWKMLGLELLALLSSNKIAEFHFELELIPIDYLSNPFIAYGVKLEQELMEGSYSQLWNASAQAPAPEFHIFVDVLVDTVRERILSCCEDAYQSLSLTDAAQLLNLPNPQIAKDFCLKRNWIVDQDGKLVFPDAVSHKTHEIPAHRIVQQTLGYAVELERII
jgi:26S proteasome regulatory subunit N12